MLETLTRMALSKRVEKLEAENAALKEALADAGSGPGFWFRGWEKAREHFQRQEKGDDLDV